VTGLINLDSQVTGGKQESKDRKLAKLTEAKKKALGCKEKNKGCAGSSNT
jgi:hypothetical protein